MTNEITIDHFPDEPTPENTGLGSFHPMGRLTGKVALTCDDLLHTRLDVWWIGIDSASQEMGDRMVGEVIQVLSEVCESTGNVTDGGGEPLSYDHILDMFEKVDFEVDENLQFKGNPVFLMSPEMVQRLSALGPPSQEQEERHKRIMIEKRDRQNAQKRLRKLD
jgi:hypothetical protein